MIKAAVLGSPISHSLSPALHKRAYLELGLNASYEGIEVKSGELASFLANLHSPWTGFSLTMPLKEEVLDSLDSVSDVALRAHSANTMYRVDGKWRGDSTDVSGVKRSLQPVGLLTSDEIFILGAGATARAVAVACDGVVGRIRVASRSAAREAAMRSAIWQSEIEFVPWGDTTHFVSSKVVINTTPAGAADSLLIAEGVAATLFEVLYHPWPSELVKRWRSSGLAVIDGLDLLINQAMDQIAIFSGVGFDKEAMFSILRDEGLSRLP